MTKFSRQHEFVGLSNRLEDFQCQVNVAKLDDICNVNLHEDDKIMLKVLNQQIASLYDRHDFSCAKKIG